MSTEHPIAKTLITAMGDEALRGFLKKLNRTRRPLQLFSINGNASYTTRRWARQAVIDELASRAGRVAQ